MRPSWPERVWPLFLLIWVVLFSLALSPGGSGPLKLFNISLPNFCGFRLLTGFPCPFCGMTRSLVSLLHGQWEEAFRLHPLTPVLLLLLALYSLYRLTYGRDPASLPVLGKSFLVLLCVVWLFRLFS